MDSDALLIGLVLVLCAALVVVRGTRFDSDGMDIAERSRRSKNGDAMALAAEQREMLLPSARGAAVILTVLLSTAVAFTIVSIIPNRPLAAIVIIATLLAVELLAIYLRSQAAQLQVRYETAILQRLANVSILKYFAPAETQAAKTIDSTEELAALIAKTSVLSGEKKTQLTSVISYDQKRVNDVMTPKSMMVSVDANEGIGPLVIDELHKSGHSRFPVIEKDADHIVGMLYLHDLVTLKSAHSTVKQAMDPHVYYIKDEQSLAHALHAFLHTHHHLFIVVNSYRETVGLLSLEDVIEAMLGMLVVDEFDEFQDLRKVADSNPHALNEPKRKVDV